MGKGKGRLGFVNSQQNSRIKETGLKGSQSLALAASGARPFPAALGGVAVAPFVGLDRLARDPLSRALGTLRSLGRVGRQSLLSPLRLHEPGVCPLPSPACGQGGGWQAERLAEAGASPEMAAPGDPRAGPASGPGRAEAGGAGRPSGQPLA